MSIRNYSNVINRGPEPSEVLMLADVGTDSTLCISIGITVLKIRVVLSVVRL